MFVCLFLYLDNVIWNISAHVYCSETSDITHGNTVHLKWKSFKFQWHVFIWLFCLRIRNQEIWFGYRFCNPVVDIKAAIYVFGDFWSRSVCCLCTTVSLKFPFNRVWGTIHLSGLHMNGNQRSFLCLANFLRNCGTLINGTFMNWMPLLILVLLSCLILLWIYTAFISMQLYVNGHYD